MNDFKVTVTDFLLSEDGAITSDWVVLTAGVAGLGLAVLAVLSGGVMDMSGDIDSQLETQEIATNFTEEEPVTTP